MSEGMDENITELLFQEETENKTNSQKNLKIISHTPRANNIKRAGSHRTDRRPRRKMRGLAPVSRDYIRMLLDKIDTIQYGEALGGLSVAEQRLRNKALVSLLYLSARRISEVVGRTYKGDVCKGLFLEDFRKDTLDGGRVQIISFRILKKWKRKVDQPRIVYADVIIDMNDKPFIEYIRRWWNHLYDLRQNVRQKYMPISRSRAYQIVREIDDRIIGPHWFRHQRLSHLAETLSPFQLNERIGFWESIDPAIAYVHGSVGKYLDACKKARRRKIPEKISKIDSPKPKKRNENLVG